MDINENSEIEKDDKAEKLNYIQDNGLGRYFCELCNIKLNLHTAKSHSEGLKHIRKINNKITKEKLNTPLLKPVGVIKKLSKLNKRLQPLGNIELSNLNEMENIPKLNIPASFSLAQYTNNCELNQFESKFDKDSNSVEDSILVSKYNSILLPKPEIENLLQFVSIIEETINILMEEFRYSKLLFEYYKNHKALFNIQSFERVISSYSRLDVLATQLFLDSDTKFKIALLIDPSIKPTIFVYDDIYNHLVDVINKEYSKKVIITREKFQFCTIEDSGKKYIVEIILSSMGWIDFNPIDDANYLMFNPIHNINIINSIKLSNWFISIASKSTPLIILSTLARYICTVKNPLNALSFWLPLIISVNVIATSCFVIGPFKAFRRIFSLLSSGILLPGGDLIPHPLGSTYNLYSELSDKSRQEVTAFSQYVLRMISRRKLNEILD